jgi:hypothetical protein
VVAKILYFGEIADVKNLVTIYLGWPKRGIEFFVCMPFLGNEEEIQIQKPH